MSDFSDGAVAFEFPCGDVYRVSIKSIISELSEGVADAYFDGDREQAEYYLECRYEFDESNLITDALGDFDWEHLEKLASPLPPDKDEYHDAWNYNLVKATVQSAVRV